MAADNVEGMVKIMEYANDKNMGVPTDNDPN